MNVIECKDLSKSYREVKALENINLAIKENTITGLIGRNGAGKTTLLKLIVGFWRETSGDVTVFGKRPFNNLTVSANSIFIDDTMNFPASLTLNEVLEEGHRFYPNWDMAFARKMFDYFSFHPKQSHASLSKGKTSTFNMIAGLASRCPLTIFDEPTTGMDTAARKDFYRALLKDYLAHPRTIIISSHHLEEIENLLEDVLLLDNGKVHLHLPMEALKEYAIGLSGKTAILIQWVRNKEIFHTQKSCIDDSYVVIRNNLSNDSLEQARQLGLEISPISPNDLCMHLTKKTKGGIDDVFSDARFG